MKVKISGSSFKKVGVHRKKGNPRQSHQKGRGLIKSQYVQSILFVVFCLNKYVWEWSDNSYTECLFWLDDVGSDSNYYR